MSTGCREKVLIGKQYTHLHPGRAWCCLMFNHLQKATYKKIHRHLIECMGIESTRQSARTSQFQYSNVVAGRKVRTKFYLPVFHLENLSNYFWGLDQIWPTRREIFPYCFFPSFFVKFQLLFSAVLSIFFSSYQKISKVSCRKEESYVFLLSAQLETPKLEPRKLSINFWGLNKKLVLKNCAFSC